MRRNSPLHVKIDGVGGSNDYPTLALVGQEHRFPWKRCDAVNAVNLERELVHALLCIVPLAEEMVEAQSLGRSPMACMDQACQWEHCI